MRDRVFVPTLLQVGKELLDAFLLVGFVRNRAGIGDGRCTRGHQRLPAIHRAAFAASRLHRGRDPSLRILPRGRRSGRDHVLAPDPRYHGNPSPGGSLGGAMGVASRIDGLSSIAVVAVPEATAAQGLSSGARPGAMHVGSLLYRPCGYGLLWLGCSHALPLLVLVL